MNRTEYIAEAMGLDSTFERIQSTIVAHGLPAISVAPEYGRLLTFLVKSTRSSHILEIGALAGYSSICLARGLESTGTVDSIELKSEFAQLAAQNATDAGLGERITYHVGAAVDVLSQLEGLGKSFDFFFLDADKPNYPTYLEQCLRLATDGALIVADNIFLGNRVLNPSNQDPSTLGMRLFHERILKNPSLETLLFPMHDGLSVTRVRRA